MEFLGPSPTDPGDIATKDYVDANSGGAAGPAGPVTSQVFVQQTDPETTDPEYSGPAIWYQTDGSGNVVAKHIRSAAPTYNPSVTSPWNGLAESPLAVPSDEIQPIPFMLATDHIAVASGSIRMTLFVPTKDVTVSTIGTTAWYNSSQAAATFCRVGIYRVDDLAWPFDINCIARSAHSAARWGVGGLNSAPIVDNGAASPSAITSVTLTAGQMYGVALLSVGHTGTVDLMCKTVYRRDNWDVPLSMYFDGQTGLPPQLTGVGWFMEWDHPWVSLK